MTEIHEVPKPFLKGRFNAYETPDGGFVIAYHRDGDPADEIQHINLPGALIRMAKAMSEGKLNPLEAIKGLSKMKDINVLYSTGVLVWQVFIRARVSHRSAILVNRRFPV